MIRSALLLLLVLAPLAAHAQRPGPGPRPGPPGGPEVPGLRLTASVEAGASFFSSFLEQRDPVTGRERELNAETAPTFGVTLGARVLPRTSARITAAYTATDFRFADDTGDGGDDLDEDDLGSLNLFTAGAEVRTGTPLFEGAVTPYGIAGVTLGVWTADDEGTALTGADETLVRLGTQAGGGLSFRVTPRVQFYAEATVASLGNPFDGATSFRLADDAGATFDEPGRVTITRAIGGLSVTF